MIFVISTNNLLSSCLIDNTFTSIEYSPQECPGRFYCEDEGMNWVRPNQVCDNTKHCESGRDECEDCYYGSLASSELLIKSIPIGIATVIGGICISAINIRVGYHTWMSEVSTKSGEIDRLLRLQVCFYDFLMGVYLTLIVVAGVAIRASGRYCRQDQSWRSSIFCNCLGMIFSFSSHGSLLVVSIISIIRCINCSLLFIEIPVRFITCLSIICLVVNTAHALLPVLSITNFFHSGIFLYNFTRNPFFSQAGNLNVTHLKEIHRTMFNLNSETENNMNDIHQTVRELENITSDANAFSITDIGYYGNSPLCMGNIFKLEADRRFLFYRNVYFIIIGMLLLAVSISYTIIVITKNRSQARIRHDVDGLDQGPSPLTVKVSLMIISQLAAWCSFIGVACYFTWWVGESPPSLVFEIFALLVIPVNSLLNPVFYSTFYKTIKEELWLLWRYLMRPLRPRVIINPLTEREMYPR